MKQIEIYELRDVVGNVPACTQCILTPLSDKCDAAKCTSQGKPMAVARVTYAPPTAHPSGADLNKLLRDKLTLVHPLRPHMEHMRSGDTSLVNGRRVTAYLCGRGMHYAVYLGDRRVAVKCSSVAQALEVCYKYPLYHREGHAPTVPTILNIPYEEFKSCV